MHEEVGQRTSVVRRRLPADLSWLLVCAERPRNCTGTLLSLSEGVRILAAYLCRAQLGIAFSGIRARGPSPGQNRARKRSGSAAERTDDCCGCSLGSWGFAMAYDARLATYLRKALCRAYPQQQPSGAFVTAGNVRQPGHK